MTDRSADRHLDASTVTNLIAEQFPSIRADGVRALGSGWDNDVYLVDGDWIFRFPRRAEGVPWLRREIEIMPYVVEKLGSLVPHLEWLGRPSSAFPYPFVGYRRLAGVGADQAALNDLRPLAMDLGHALSRLHEIDPGLIPPTPAGWESQSWSRTADRLMAVAHVVRPLLEGPLRERAEPYLTGRVPPPAQDGPGRFVHNDICADHVLVDPPTGRLTGIIDFTDAMVGEPVADFVGLIEIGSRTFIEQVVRNYDHDLGSTFTAKLEWLCRVLHLRWLADACTDDPDQVARHLSWVQRAFE